jgi:peptidyl-prolyl cis-trans isomerase B (cyclophilin B)
MYNDEAPNTVANFVQYVNDGFFDGLIFHRVIPGFMIQGGGHEPGMKRRQTRAPIENEADNGLKNVRGSLSMARTNDPHSATSQFFINLKDNDFLDYRSSDASGWGYAVFARVVSGMDVVDQIAKTPTGKSAGHDDVPLEDVVIEKAEVME